IPPASGPPMGRLSRQPGRASPVQLEAPARQSGQDVRHVLRARGDRRPARRGARGIPRAPRAAPREALAAFLALHGRRWEGRGGSTAFYSEALREFHEAWTRVALGRGWLRFFLMRLDGRPVGAISGVGDGG